MRLRDWLPYVRLMRHGRYAIACITVPCVPRALRFAVSVDLDDNRIAWAVPLFAGEVVIGRM